MTQQFPFWVFSPTFEYTYLQRYMYPCAHCCTIPESQDVDTTGVPFDGQLNKGVVACIHNGMLVSHKKWNIAICDNMDGSWEYHAKWNKSDGRGQEPNDFTHMWDISQKATHKLIDPDYSMVPTRGEGAVGEGKEGKGGQMSGDGGRLDFGWWAHMGDTYISLSHLYPIYTYLYIHLYPISFIHSPTD